MNPTHRLISSLAAVALTAAVTAFAFGGPQLSSSRSDDSGKDKMSDTKKVELGEKVPDFTLTDLDGKEHTLSDYKGKYIVLEWTNPECPYIRGVYGKGVVDYTLKQMEEMFGDDAVYLAVNSSSNKDRDAVVAQNKAFLKKHDVDVPVLIDYDGMVGRMFGARHTPDIYVIDTDMKLRYFGGFTDDKNFRNGNECMNYALNALKQLKAGETVSPDTATRWGCSVKYSRKR